VVTPAATTLTVAPPQRRGPRSARARADSSSSSSGGRDRTDSSVGVDFDLDFDTDEPRSGGDGGGGLMTLLRTVASEAAGCWSVAGTLFQRPHLRPLLLLQFAWFTLSMSTYGLSIWVPSLFAHVGFKSSRFADSFIFTAAQVPACAIGTVAVDHASVGRRRLLVAGALLTTLCTGAFALHHSDKAMALTLICCYQVFTTLTWNALDVLATEAFPAGARSTAFALQSAAGRVGAIVGQFLFSYLIDVSVTALLGACAAITVLTTVAGLALPSDEALGGAHAIAAAANAAQGTKLAVRK
jgi:hypothetical protein